MSFSDYRTALVTGAAYGGVQSVTLIQSFADGDDQHRVSVAWNVGFDLGTGLGAAVVGVIAAQSSFRAAFFALACGCLLAAAALSAAQLWTRDRRLAAAARDLNLAIP